MTKRNMQLGDVPSVVNHRKRAKAKRRPAKVTTWEGWAVITRDDFPITYPERMARYQARTGLGKLVHVVAKLREVKP